MPGRYIIKVYSCYCSKKFSGIGHGLDQQVLFSLKKFKGDGRDIKHWIRLHEKIGLQNIN